MADDSGKELARFFQLLGRDSRLQAQVRACITADEVALIAQDNGFAVTGAQLLLASGRTQHGVTIARVDHPGEYNGRYY
jgi:predicted ribosomally synthesized peptide with nif11-like leader